jgi:SAM-dependent methyltransferase
MFGRMTIWLAKVFDKVFAADISTGHLSVAAQAIAREGLSNVKLIKFDNFDSVDSLPEFDVFVSFIVLQHNPPPLAAALIEKILRKIRVGGVACFQCQTYLHDYNFAVADYVRFIDGMGSGDSWEMHCVPQSVVYDIFARNGFSLLEAREDAWTKTGISSTFLARRHCR